MPRHDDNDHEEGTASAQQKPRRPAKKSSNTALFMWIGAGVLLVSCCCVGGVGGIAFVVISAFKDKNLGSTFPVEEKGKWTSSDPLTALPNGDPGRPYKAYKVTLKANKTYIIELVRNSGNSDPYLVLKDSTDKVVAHDDDSGGGLNARIAFTPTTAGEYRIIAATIGDVSDFTLTVREN